MFELNNKIKLKPVFNRKNGQINFSIKKSAFPKDYKKKLCDLKSIKIDKDSFEFN